jgi:hypothetical protein
MSIQPAEPKKPPIIALVLAFLPAVMILALFTFKFQFPSDWLAAPCFISVVCCFVSSFMLFARKTGLAILAGVLFLLLNGLIAFFFGCAATFRM